MIRPTVLSLGLICLGAAAFARAASSDDLGTTNTGRAAFAQPFSFITGKALDKFREGAGIFRQPWLVGPSDEQPRFDGLGPLSQRLSCIACHVGNGRGEPSANENDVMRTTLVRLSVPGRAADGGPVPEPTYGDQFQTVGVSGVPNEGDITTRWHEQEQRLGDGARIALRRSELVIKNAHYGPLAQGTMTSVRMSPVVYGMGLLAAVPDDELVSLADPDDKNGDGVRGRVNRVWDVEAKRAAIGRFGLKANQPSLRQQVAGALHGDLGITSRVFPEQNCSAAQTACRNAAIGAQPEISDADLDTLVAYMQAVAPPLPRATNKDVQPGETLFERIGCAACHAPKLTTGAVADLPQLSNREIRPYTDLLLHDMGPGLADGRPDFEASGNDWRTAPLWGIGLSGTVNEHATYLHDGRARNLTEAILWHGGEAERARESFAALTGGDREAIIAFLNSL